MRRARFRSGLNQCCIAPTSAAGGPSRPASEEETPADPFVGLYSYLSYAFYWDVLVPALDTQREELLVQCFGFIEELLQSDTWVVEAGQSRIVDWLSSQRQWSDTVNRHAGPALRRELVQPQPESTD